MRASARPLVLGHRGAPQEAPENTMLAFRLAREQGADGVELDVHPSADGVPVVIHDLALDRTTDGDGVVAALPWAHLSGVRSRGEPLPRLEAVVAWAAETGAWLNVEVKSAGAEGPAVFAVEEAGVMARTFFSSFRPEIVAEVMRLAPGVPCYLLTEHWNDRVRAGVRELGVGGVCLHHSIAGAEVLEEVRAQGLEVVVWTVDDPARIRELLSWGVRALITNRPADAVAILRELYGPDESPAATS